MTKRVSAIDWIKLILAIGIMVFHYGEVTTMSTGYSGQILPGGSLAVEGFFLISGFLFMRSLERYETTGAYPACPKVVFRRYLLVLYWLLPAVVVDAFVVWNGVEMLTFSEMLTKVPKLLFEVVPLQMAGFSAEYVTGVSWYISAMLLCVLFFYPLARRNPRSFARELCPAVAVILYGMLYYNTHCLINPAEWMFHVVRKGLLRGVADMATGCFLYECIRASKKETVRVFRRIVYTIAAAGCAAGCVAIILFTKASYYDFIFVFLAFGFLYLSIGQKTVFALFLNHEWTKHLATVSTIVFLVHYPLARCFAAWYPPLDVWSNFTQYLLYVAASMVVVFIAGMLFKGIVWYFSVFRKEKANDTPKVEE